MQDGKLLKSSPAKLLWAQNHYALHREEISKRNNERQKAKRKQMIASGLLPDRPKGRPKKSFEEKLSDLARAEGKDVVIIMQLIDSSLANAQARLNRGK
jgi:hypothetical protein